MTQEEWDSSNDAKAMLRALYADWPRYFKRQAVPLHRFLIACCWKHIDLMPQRSLRDGIKGAEQWLAGSMSYKELYELHYGAEGTAYFLDYCDKADDIEEIQKWIDKVASLDGLPFEQARALLTRAAYFAERTILYSTAGANRDPKSLDSGFLCANLLREHLQPEFGRWRFF